MLAHGYTLSQSRGCSLHMCKLEQEYLEGGSEGGREEAREAGIARYDYSG